MVRRLRHPLTTDCNREGTVHMQEWMVQAPSNSMTYLLVWHLIAPWNPIKFEQNVNVWSIMLYNFTICSNYTNWQYNLFKVSINKKFGKIIILLKIYLLKANINFIIRVDLFSYKKTNNFNMVLRYNCIKLLKMNITHNICNFVWVVKYLWMIRQYERLYTLYYKPSPCLHIVINS